MGKLSFPAAGVVSEPPDVLAGSVTSSAVTLTWNPPDMPNGVITSYTVNLVATSSNAGITESGRTVVGVVTACVMRNGGDVKSNTTVGGDQTSLTVTNLGMCLQCMWHPNQCWHLTFHYCTDGQWNVQETYRVKILAEKVRVQEHMPSR